MPDNIFKHRASALLLKYLQDHLNGEEQHELDEWIAAAPEHQQLFEEMTDSNLVATNLAELESLQQRIAEKMYEDIPEARQTVPLFRKTFFRVASAAAIFIILATGVYFLFFNKEEKKAIIKTEQPTDIEAPTITKATITLADGRTVLVDNLSTLTQSNVQLSKTADGKIVYSGNAVEVVYNTLTNPRGSKVVDMILSDGSHVWLNAGSSITYPVAFANKDREVQITGEAYFEVTSNVARPFIVSRGTTSITVLGTHFNVNAYEDETDIRVTLLEGSVRVSAESGSLTIKPNQQAVIKRDAAITINNDVDVEQVMAWKNGYFQFRESDIQTIMRQVARWYDVEIKYEGAIPTGHYNGKPSRDLSASQMLKVVEYSGVKIKIEGKKIVVMK